MQRVVRVLLAVILLLLPTATAVAADQRSYVAGRFALELDGVVVGSLQDAGGGYPYADVVAESVGADQIVRKHIAGVKYEDITVSFGAGMGKPLYEWIKASFDNKFERKSGSIIYLNDNGRERSRLTFTNALITEVGFPALDASSKDAAKMTLKLVPEVTRRSTKSAGQPVRIDAGKQKQWLPANFRFSLDGLEQTTARVNKIEAIVVKQKVVENPVGEMRDYEKEPAHLEIPNLQVSLADLDADGMLDWADSFIVQGLNGQGEEKAGSLDYLDTDGNSLFHLGLDHVGIAGVETAREASSGLATGRITATLYVEGMSFSYAA